MDRRSFIKNAALATVAGTACVSLLESSEPTQYDVMEAIKAQIQSAKFPPQQIVMGWENDDFTNNMLTICIDGAKTHIPIYG